MRILHINLSLAGIGRYGLLLGRGLARLEGVEALSVFDRRLLMDSPFLKPVAEGLQYATVPGDAGFRHLKVPARLAAIARSFQPDVIHDTAGSTSPLGLLYWPVLSRMVPLVITEHDPVPHTDMGRWLRSRAARAFVRRRAHRIVVHGAACRRMLLERDVPPERVLSEKHGHLGFFDRGRYADVVEEPKTILFFGKLRPNKGLDYLLPVADRVRERHPAARFLVAGSRRVSKQLRTSAWIERMDSAIEEMERRSHFELQLGFVSDEEVERLFRRAGLVLLPYRDATQSGVVMIALAFGRPIVATDVGDIGEVVRHEETGLLCEPDADSIAAAVIRLLDDPGLAARLGAAARAFARSECSWEGIAARMRDHYGVLAPDRA